MLKEKVPLTDFYKDTGNYSLMRLMNDRVVWAGLIFLGVMFPLDVFCRNAVDLPSIITVGLGLVGLGFGAKLTQKIPEVEIEKKEIENSKLT